jgi:hypothetical protein
MMGSCLNYHGHKCYENYDRNGPKFKSKYKTWK